MDSHPQEPAYLLTRYRASLEASDFEAIVERYAGMVIGVAQRRSGDRGLAEEVAQNVFALLVKKADQIDPANLAGWLHRTSLLDASNALRKETRRKKKLEAFSLAMESETAPPTGGDSTGHDILPLLDTAIDSLSDGERKVVLLRFFEQRTFKEIGDELGLGEDAGRKRLSRALEKLSCFLKRRSVTSTTAAVAFCLSDQAAHGVTPTLVQSLSQSALAGTVPTAASISLAGTLNHFMATSKLTAAALVIIGAVLPVSIGWMVNGNAIDTVVDQGTAAAPDEPLITSSTASQSSDLSKKLKKESIDLQSLAREINGLPYKERSLERELALRLLMFELSEEQFLPVLDILKTVSDPFAVREITAALFARWAQFDPEQAFAAATDLKDSKLRYPARRGAIQTWAASDPDSAIAFLASEPDAKSNSSLVYSALSILASRDRTGAMEKIADIPDAEVRLQLQERLAKFWAEAEPEEAFDWAQSMEDDGLRSRYSKAVLESLATSRPGKALDFALTLDHPQAREDSARWALMQWGPIDPDAATTAYLELPESMRTKNFTNNVSMLLVGGDPERAISIASQLTEGSREWGQFLKLGAMDLAATAPAEAAALAELLPEGGDRKHALEQIGRKWVNQDEEAALEWIERTGALSEKQLRKILDAN